MVAAESERTGKKREMANSSAEGIDAVQCAGWDEPPDEKVDSVRVDEFLDNHGR
jgi:hypothetical protein